MTINPDFSALSVDIWNGVFNYLDFTDARSCYSTNKQLSIYVKKWILQIDWTAYKNAISDFGKLKKICFVETPNSFQKALLTFFNENKYLVLAISFWKDLHSAVVARFSDDKEPIKNTRDIYEVIYCGNISNIPYFPEKSSSVQRKNISSSDENDSSDDTYMNSYAHSHTIGFEYYIPPEKGKSISQIVMNTMIPPKRVLE